MRLGCLLFRVSGPRLGNLGLLSAAEERRVVPREWRPGWPDTTVRHPQLLVGCAAECLSPFRRQYPPGHLRAEWGIEPAGLSVLESGHRIGLGNQRSLRRYHAPSPPPVVPFWFLCIAGRRHRHCREIRSFPGPAQAGIAGSTAVRDERERRRWRSRRAGETAP